MGRQSDAGQGWFDEALGRAGIDGSRLARARSARRPVVERSNPWQDADGIDEAGRILAAARGSGKKQAHLLFVTDIDDDPIARVQAAVQLARAAVAKGVDVLLVDADIRHVGLSRWLQDRDLDAEGLVDVLQYGASVSGARRPSEVDGIDVLGVGSYRPDAATVFGQEELRRLYSQLRADAGLVIVVAPAYLADGRFQPLVRGADSVVLSMHLDAGLAGSLGEFLSHLVELETPLGGAMLWAGPDDSDRFVDDALLERSRVLPRATAASPFPGRGPDSSVPDVPGDGDDDTPVTVPMQTAAAAAKGPVPAQSKRGRWGKSGGGDVNEGPESVRIATERPRPGSSGSTGSSPVARSVLGVVALGLVAFVVWWAMTWKSVEPTRPRVQPPERSVAGVRTAYSGGQAVADSQVAVQAADELPGEMADEAADVPGTSGESPALESTKSAAGVQTAREIEGLLAEPVESAPAEVAVVEAADAFEAGLRREGQAGWGLHLSSFTSQSEAEIDRARLQGRGYSVVVRPATIKGKQWYRVLVGHWDSKAGAAAFRVRAEEKFHSDWVGVVKK
ncbi:hypothetical protein DRQ53_04420 [bacterium]|nr:MAG: hypothetical protein DRQ32_00125 [bacterium]RKZ17144.1 MAG: hypothetical protein DRQ53_04420 [bacterium]